MATDYITREELKHTLELSGNTFADYDIERAITSASRSVDAYAGRRFYADTDATSVHYYSPYDTGYVTIDDLIVCGTVESDYDGDGTFETTWTVNRDFVLEPLNAALVGKPWEQLCVHPRGYYRLSSYPRSLKITGQFGWPAVPEPVRTVTTIMATRTVTRMRSAPFGVIGLGIDNVAVRIPQIDPDLRFHLDPFVKGGGVLAA